MFNVMSDCFDCYLKLLVLKTGMKLKNNRGCAYFESCFEMYHRKKKQISTKPLGL